MKTGLRNWARRHLHVQEIVKQCNLGFSPFLSKWIHICQVKHCCSTVQLRNRSDPTCHLTWTFDFSYWIYLFVLFCLDETSSSCQNIGFLNHVWILQTDELRCRGAQEWNIISPFHRVINTAQVFNSQIWLVLSIDFSYWSNWISVFSKIATVFHLLSYESELCNGLGVLLRCSGLFNKTFF